MILTTNLLNKDSTELIINSLDKENRIFDAIKKKRASRTEPNRLLSEGGYKFDEAKHVYTEGTKRHGIIVVSSL